MNEFLKEIIKSIGDLNLILLLISFFFNCMSVLVTSKENNINLEPLFNSIAKLILIALSSLLTYITNNNSFEYMALILMIYSVIKSIDKFICELSFTVVVNLKLKMIDKNNENKPI